MYRFVSIKYDENYPREAAFARKLDYTRITTKGVEKLEEEEKSYPRWPVAVEVKLSSSNQ